MNLSLTKMAKWVIFIGLAVGVLIVGIGLSKKSMRMLRAGSEMALLMDVMSFSEANTLRMPRDWNEFEAWCASRTNKSHWEAANLVPLYTLPWGKPLTELDLTNGVLIEILDPSRCPIPQERANAYMRCFAIAALMPTNALPSKEINHENRPASGERPLYPAPKGQ